MTGRAACVPTSRPWRWRAARPRRSVRSAPDRRSPHRCRTRRRYAGRSASRDRKSTRLNSSHITISYAVFCLKKKKKKQNIRQLKKKKKKKIKKKQKTKIK